MLEPLLGAPVALPVSPLEVVSSLEQPPSAARTATSPPANASATAGAAEDAGRRRARWIGREGREGRETSEERRACDIEIPFAPAVRRLKTAARYP
jgi:hypothetical protein